MRNIPRRSVFFGLLLGSIAGYALFVTVAWLRPSLMPVQQVLAQQSQSSPFTEAEKVQEAFRTVSAEVLPSVVEVTVKSDGIVPQGGDSDQPWNDFFQNPQDEKGNPKYFQSQGLGSGIIIERRNDEYFVITNAHVIGNSEEIYIRLNRGSTLPAELAGKDERKDLALLKFSSPDMDLPVIRLGDSDKLYVGDWVLAFGSPFGYAQSVSSGIVSALGRQDGPGDNINDFIQTDASINQGNSGGALVNIRGELVGINTFITTPNSGSIGLGFAIPVNNIITSFRQLIDNGEVRYGWLGVSLGEIAAESAESLGYKVNEGAMVYQVFEDSPAYEAGLQPGDLITSLDGKPVVKSERLIYRVGDKAPGDIALFTVNRFGEVFQLEAEMGAREGEEAVRALHGRAVPGFVAAPLVPDLRELMKLPDDINGVAVAEVYPRTFAQSVDLRAGDIIIAVNNKTIVNLKDLYLAIGPLSESSPAYTVFRNGETLKLENSPGENS
ncbi:MAG: serine protease [Spirochaetes bacterium]|nr:MAG: serine protease [Spirochaetota bacterium]